MSRKVEMGGMTRTCSNLDAARAPFAFATITILSLLVPLSFLLLSRLSGESYLSSLSSSDDQVGLGRLNCNRSEANPTTVGFFRHTISFLVQVLVSIISIAALFHGMTGKSILIQDDSDGQRFSQRIYAAWIFLCTFQICVGLGVEASIETGISSYKISLGTEIGILSRVIFFLGLHETMSHWSKTIVKPIVDDTVFGVKMQERVMQKVSLAIACGWLWWWRLRDEIETLVIVAEIKQKVGMDVCLADLMSWWLYYIVATIGLLRIVQSFIWGAMYLCCRSSLRINPASFDRIECDEKV